MSTSISFDLIARDRASGTFDKVGNAADRSSSKLKTWGKVGVASAAIIGPAVLGVGKYLFGHAAKLEQMGAKADTVFGNQIGMVDSWAKANARAMGLTTREATGLAANFGDLLIPMGFARKEAAKMSTDVVGLSGALSQWSGGTKSAAEVSEILAAAMLGERDSLKSLGISITEADVKARLLKNGQDKLTGTALQQAEAIATQQLIMEKSTDAQAAYAKGGAPLLSAQNKLKASVGELRDKLALKLIPAFTSLVVGFEEGTGAGGEIRDVLDDVATAGKAVAGAIDSIPGPVKRYGAEIAVAVLVTSKLRSLMGPMSLGLSTMSTNFKSAETRAAGLKAGLRGLGSGLMNVAGAGGMMLLADSTNEVSKGVGALKGAAGGALLGGTIGSLFMPGVGTAIGAGIGAIGGGLISLATHTEEAETVMEKLTVTTKYATGDFKEYEGTLLGVTAATTKQTEALIYQKLEAAGVLDKTRALGIEDRTVIGTVRGNVAARKELNKELRENKATASQFAQAIGLEEAGVRASRIETARKNLALADTPEKAAAARKALQKLGEVTVQPTIKMGNLIVLKNQAAGLLGLLQDISSFTGSTSGQSLNRDPSGLFPQMATGGVVKARPGGTIVRLAEAGHDEAVIPLSGPNAPKVATASASSSPAIDYDRLARTIVSALRDGTQLVRLPDAGRGSYLAGASL